MYLKQIRAKKNISARELSELSGVPLRTIEDIEKRGSCKTDTAVKLAIALNINLHDLICGMTYEGKYASVDLRDVLDYLIGIMPIDSIKTMIKEINTFSDGIHMRAMNQAYFLYEHCLDLQEHNCTWKTVIE